MLMFTKITCSYRAKIVEAMMKGDIVGLFVTKGPLESHQKGVGENFAGASRGDQYSNGDTLQPHDLCDHRRLTEVGLPLTSLNIDPGTAHAPYNSQIIKEYCFDVATHMCRPCLYAS
ncbi:unnamed protein product [Pieris macdunnoughi]|uniref:Uncharacterized protein n=1 Tax=Pieris macdunnoughi TaxID=345717 RepID=A0A821PBR4_9NEOP|nr:unnamed protein product [Pieris macdunnoughi]